jgi:hypothetical protein
MAAAGGAADRPGALVPDRGGTWLRVAPERGPRSPAGGSGAGRDGAARRSGYATCTMPTDDPTAKGTDAPARTHRLLVIANETCAGSELFELIRERAEGPDSEVLIVAPALTSRLRYWMSDEDAGIEEAGQRLAVSVERCGAAGVVARGALGDADPLQALDDAMRTFVPHEVIIATHPAGRSNWLEHGLVVQARERFDVPITHVAVDVARQEAELVEREPADSTAPARERHTGRDLALLAVAGILAILGSLISFVFYATGAPDWVTWTWVLIFDLGFKIAAAIVLWVLFQRRARADRLDL